jgi:hypothetical protein
MKINHLPTFEVTLPLSKDVVKFRPFVMKEEKLLLMAAESKDEKDVFHAIDSAVRGCTFDKVSCDSHSMVDVQYLFLQIRGKSVGEELEYNLICGECSSKTPGFLNLEEIKVKEVQGHSNKINISNDVVVTMKYPKVKHLAVLSQEDSDIEKVYDVVAECIETIQTSEEVFSLDNSSLKDMREFVDNLTAAQFEKIQKFFGTMPAIRHTIEFNCKGCGKTNQIVLDDIVNFFG